MVTARLLVFLFFLCGVLHADAPADQSNTKEVLENSLNLNKNDFLPLGNQLRIVGFLALVSLIPFGIMMMTSFTRVSIIFQFLRQALGSAQVPSNQIIMGLSLLLTGYIMHPVINKINQDAFTPYFEGKFKELPLVAEKKESEERVLFTRAWQPLREFLLSQVREKDLMLFLEIGNVRIQKNSVSSDSSGGMDPDQIPWYCLVPAFILSELRLAFMIGFLLFLPFLIIDMVTASILMSMGMMMLPPIMVSTPFKILLFILVDGWRLIVQQIIAGYQ